MADEGRGRRIVNPLKNAVCARRSQRCWALGGDALCNCGPSLETVRDAVQMGRNLGFVIEGDHELGYRYVGFRRIRKVRVAKAVEWPSETDPQSS
jgi:hypothetical protein